MGALSRSQGTNKCRIVRNACVCSRGSIAHDTALASIFVFDRVRILHHSVEPFWRGKSQRPLFRLPRLENHKFLELPLVEGLKDEDQCIRSPKRATRPISRIERPLTTPRPAPSPPRDGSARDLPEVGRSSCHGLRAPLFEETSPLETTVLFSTRRPHPTPCPSAPTAARAVRSLSFVAMGHRSGLACFLLIISGRWADPSSVLR